MKKHDAEIFESLGKATDWEYLNEGNLNIICRYTGPDPTLKGYVLRVKKNTHSAAFTEIYGIPEPRYRGMFDESLKACPDLLAFFPEDVLRRHDFR